MISRLILLIASGFGAGYLPPFPGTYGTLVGMGVYILLILLKVEPLEYIIVVAGIFFLGVYTSTKAEIIVGTKDSSHIVIDEILGYLLTMFLIPLSFKTLVISFFINRFLDITKPFPASKIHQLKGGWGVMFDDVVSGIYSNLVMQTLVIIFSVGATQPA